MADLYYNPMTYRPPILNTTSTQLLRVNGIEGAKAYPTMPNSVVALFDANEDFMYIKSTDSANYPTIDTYKFQKVVPEPPKDLKEEYLTRKEFLEFKEELLNAKQSVSKPEPITKPTIEF